MEFVNFLTCLLIRVSFPMSGSKGLDVDPPGVYGTGPAVPGSGAALPPVSTPQAEFSPVAVQRSTDLD